MSSPNPNDNNQAHLASVIAMQQHAETHHPSGNNVSAASPDSLSFPDTIGIQTKLGDELHGGNIGEFMTSSGIKIGPDSLTHDAAFGDNMLTKIEAHAPLGLTKGIVDTLQGHGDVQLKNLAADEQLNAPTTVSGIHNPGRDGR